jgi:hypothetical protein
MKPAILAALIALTSCASAENQAALASFQQDCAAGNPYACDLAQQQAVTNENEANQDAFAILVGGALGILVARTYEPPDQLIIIPAPR